jgi:hypothetical protein
VKLQTIGDNFFFHEYLADIQLHGFKISPTANFHHDYGGVPFDKLSLQNKLGEHGTLFQIFKGTLFQQNGGGGFFHCV